MSDDARIEVTGPAPEWDDSPAGQLGAALTQAAELRRDPDGSAVYRLRWADLVETLEALTPAGAREALEEVVRIHAEAQARAEERLRQGEARLAIQARALDATREEARRLGEELERVQAELDARGRDALAARSREERERVAVEEAQQELEDLRGHVAELGRLLEQAQAHQAADALRSRDERRRAAEERARLQGENALLREALGRREAATPAAPPAPPAPPATARVDELGRLLERLLGWSAEEGELPGLPAPARTPAEALAGLSRLEARLSAWEGDRRQVRLFTVPPWPELIAAAGARGDADLGAALSRDRARFEELRLAEASGGLTGLLELVRLRERARVHEERLLGRPLA